jgi:hypothetical protein
LAAALWQNERGGAEKVYRAVYAIVVAGWLAAGAGGPAYAQSLCDTVAACAEHCAAGDGKSCHVVALRYRNGAGVETDDARAWR